MFQVKKCEENQETNQGNSEESGWEVVTGKENVIEYFEGLNMIERWMWSVWDEVACGLRFMVEREEVVKSLAQDEAW